jgi:hypothetical protein
MRNALHNWLQSHGVLAIALGVLGTAVLISIALVGVGYLVATR